MGTNGPTSNAVGAVGAHLLAHIAHGIVHELVPVRVTSVQLAMIIDGGVLIMLTDAVVAIVGMSI